MEAVIDGLVIGKIRQAASFIAYNWGPLDFTVKALTKELRAINTRFETKVVIDRRVTEIFMLGASNANPGEIPLAAGIAAVINELGLPTRIVKYTGSTVHIAHPGDSVQALCGNRITQNKKGIGEVELRVDEPHKATCKRCLHNHYGRNWRELQKDDYEQR